jgi:hypothetical protein
MLVDKYGRACWFTAFWKGWDMALVIVATMPFLVGVGMAVSAGTGRLKVSSSRSSKFYTLSTLRAGLCLQAMVAKANDNTNTIAQEALLNMRWASNSIV